jgi:hypothetical protein
MQHNQQIFESLFGRNFSDEANTTFLKKITEQHPYFSPARFFLLEKLQDTTVAFETEAVKTNILFNNPHWLNFQLHQTKSIVVAEEEKMLASMDKPLEVESAEVDDSPDNTDEPSPDSYQQEKEIEPMHIELKMPEQKVNLTEAMLFEPMHMVDYFASQGIKLNDDVHKGDKLGKQLKSFTEWLKTMKKVHLENEADTTAKMCSYWPKTAMLKPRF